MQIGPYNLIKKLGMGGMAQTWLARRHYPTGNARVCVIKCPLKHVVANEKAMRQFELEIRVSTSLVHNNIISAFDSGEHEGVPYLVMDFVAGVDLEQLHDAVRRSNDVWDVETAVHIVREVAAGLDYAHNRSGPGIPERIVHRDVGLKNIMIDGSGGVRLMDFGVATSPSLGTSSMHVKGTFRYMAPEHYISAAGPASDVFSLGVVLWELLTGGECRHGATGQDLLEKVVAGEVGPLHRQVPNDIRELLEGMLRKDAAERPTLGAITAVLARFPHRRKEVQSTLEQCFGSVGKRTGHSQAHFAAAPELEETLAVARAARSGSPPPSTHLPPKAPVPVDFQPAPNVPTTIEATPGTDGYDDDLDPGPPADTGRAGTVVLGRQVQPPASAATALLTAPMVAAQVEAAGAGTAFVPPPSAAGHEVSDFAPPRSPERPASGPAPRPSSAPPVVSNTGEHASTSSSRTRLGVVAIVIVLFIAAGLVIALAAADPTDTPAEPMAAAERRVEEPAPTPPKAAALPSDDEDDEDDEDVPEIEFPPEPQPMADAAPDEDPGAAVAAEPDRPTKVEPELPPAAEPKAPPAAQPVAEAPKPAATPRKPTPKPTGPKVEIMLRRGLGVSFAQVRVGKRGKVLDLPARGGLPVRLRVGKHTLWSRSDPDSEFKPKRITVSTGMTYAGNVELSGLRISSKKTEPQ